VAEGLVDQLRGVDERAVEVEQGGGEQGLLELVF
jgi:hypothetical protein